MIHLRRRGIHLRLTMTHVGTKRTRNGEIVGDQALRRIDLQGDRLQIRREVEPNELCLHIE